MVAAECSKIVVVTVNIVFMIFGLAILITGVIFKTGWDDVRDAFVDKSETVDINLQSAGDTLGMSCIIFGAFMFVLSIMGCIGGCCKVKFLLVVYAIVVMIILLSQIVVVGLVAANGGDAEDKIKEGLQDSLNDYNESLSDDVSKSWSALFSTFECCGIDNRTADFAPPSNFTKSPFRTTAQKADMNPIPIACCRTFNYEDNVQSAAVYTAQDICLTQKTAATSYEVGCETKLKDFIADNKNVVIGVGIAIFVVEIVVIIIAFFLCCRNDED